jgi:vancomycin resistance protein YoaR
MAKAAKTILVAFLCVFAVAGGAGYVWAQGYVGRIAPRVFIGDLDVGGMDPEVARQMIQQRVDSLLTEGITLTINNDQANLPLSTNNGTDITEDAVFDLDQALGQALSARRSENPFLDTVLLLGHTTSETRVALPVSLNEGNIETSVRNAFPDREQPAQDAAFITTLARSGTWTVDSKDGSDGREFAFEPFSDNLKNQLSSLSSSKMGIAVEDTKPRVSLEDAKAAQARAEEALNKGARTITYQADENSQPKTWTLSAKDLADMIVPTASSRHPLGVQEEAFGAYVDAIGTDIEIAAQNARFAVENGRVTEFVGSVNGLSIDREAFKTALEEALNADQLEIALAIEVTEPEVTTDQVNDLGITEVLGVGTSSWGGSPPNRIKNIRNGVRLLNGILIAPDQEFSLLNALYPFDISNGYLPELVIKGDKIEPEVGGGLCQIGTTTFRAAMNSGLTILDRHNHSLVVSYYNDPSNGNPGTDATIYDPAPDFKFKNDTGHYILFEAQMLDSDTALRFTFWGTSDGRRGSYSPPVVSRWIGTGDPVETETTDLEPGQEKCQAAHIGADASFTYTVVKPDGEVVDTVFESHYRPLPKTCLIGVEKIDEELSTQESLQDSADNVSSLQTQPVGSLQEN